MKIVGNKQNKSPKLKSPNFKGKYCSSFEQKKNCQKLLHAEKYFLFVLLLMSIIGNSKSYQGSAGTGSTLVAAAGSPLAALFYDTAILTTALRH